ncbi:hypothetical protein N405_05800 [Helicobacter pylori FD568]|nr:hypothetical protein N405_05800 [Helicobacter pylori FD568]
MFSVLAFFFKKWVFKTLFYRFGSHFIVKLIFFYFLENIGSTLKSFSPFNPTKSPYKIALFKKLSLKFSTN